MTLGAWGLLPNSDYIISIKASNAKGESSPVFLGGSTRLTQNDASWLPINDAAESEQSRMPLLFVIVGILVTLMIMGALLTAILAVRRRREAKLNEIEVQSSSSSNQTPPNDGKTSEFICESECNLFFPIFQKTLISKKLYSSLKLILHVVSLPPQSKEKLALENTLHPPSTALNVNT